jgi:small nuclear ribonucleoprotein (snRNP)-like protein
MTEPTDPLENLRGREVVLDMASPYVIIGTLSGWDDHYLVLENADVHDLRDTTTTREMYVVKTRRHGINANRQRLLARRGDVISVAALEDVVA